MMRGKKAQDPKERSRQEFVDGKVDRWEAGVRGYSLRCYAEDGRLKLRWTQPRRRQMTAFEEDTREYRQILTLEAKRDVTEWQAGETSEAPARAVEPPRADPSLRDAAPTVQDVWLRFIQDRWPGISASVIFGGRVEVRAYYTRMSPQQREAAPSPSYLLSTIQAMQRVTAYERFAPNRLVEKIEPIHWTDYTHWRISQSRPHTHQTIATDFTRFHTALRHCRTQRRKWWGGLGDPLEGARVIRTDADVAEIPEENCLMLIRELRRSIPKGWRAYAAVVIAHASGRRIGAIGSDRLGFDACGLRASDFTSIDGRVWVTWRAEEAKGKGYGQGDQQIPATRALAVVYRWLRRCHPNPLGPDHPLLWSPQDPSRPVSYAGLNRALTGAWTRVFGEKRPRGVAFHAFCRTVATTVADALDTGKAAEYTGRTRETVEKHYKKRRPTASAGTVDRLDAVRKPMISRDRDGGLEARNRNRKRNEQQQRRKKQEKTRASQPGLNSRGRIRTYDPLINSQML
jgi:hypothetical protein